MAIAPNTLVEIKKFLKKLTVEIDQKSSFSFMNKRYVNKARVDDILCCIEANFPDELKKRKTLKSMQFYKELLKIVKHKCLFSGNLYSINYNESMKLIDYLVASFRRDFEYLNEQDNSIF